MTHDRGRIRVDLASVGAAKQESAEPQQEGAGLLKVAVAVGLLIVAAGLLARNLIGISRPRGDDNTVVTLGGNDAEPTATPQPGPAPTPQSGPSGQPAELPRIEFSPKGGAPHRHIPEAGGEPADDPATPGDDGTSS